jgi:hypothetical protein
MGDHVDSNLGRQGGQVYGADSALVQDLPHHVLWITFFCTELLVHAAFTTAFQYRSHDPIHDMCMELVA